ncbi:conserved hypothetical protein YtwI [Bacillus sp. CN2]|nr:conserved hypothetical protein YtwI [Bacillus velezensis YAU B9601-Y2]QDF49673.1 putative integral membrane protein [Bacillus velezensis]QDF53319.1 putative integral membrane protein [Bacillus velezensis]GFR55624.1 conserved hypothetical protein YtwI [Bacillus sp. CN2]
MNTDMMKEGAFRMFTQANLFLLLLLAIALVAKNQSLLFAVGFLIVIKAVGLDQKLFPVIQSKGINWGVTVITIAVLVPIATGDIGFKQLGEAMKSYYAWIALGAGIAVALIAKNGLTLLENDPHITTALVIGTILAVALFGGVAVGPLIGAGIAYLAMQIVKIFTS